MLVSILLAFITSILWGLQEVMDKLALNGITPITSALIKGSATGVISLGLLAYFFKHVKQNIYKKNKIIHWKEILLSLGAAASASIALLVMLFNLKSTSNIHIIVAIAYTSPLFTILFSKMFIENVHITLRQVIAISIIIIGVIMLITSI